MPTVSPLQRMFWISAIVATILALGVALVHTVEVVDHEEEQIIGLQHDMRWVKDSLRRIEGYNAPTP